MNRIRSRRLLAKGNAVLSVTNVVVAAGVLLVKGLPTSSSLQSVPASIRPPILWVAGRSWWVLPVLVLLGAFFGWLGRKMASPWVWDAIDSYLTIFKENWFNPSANDEFNRVTLFKYCGFHWARSPWAGWLVPVARSGHTGQLTDVAFAAPDDPSKAQGVAGLSWAKRALVRVESLPDLRNTQTEKDFDDYAKRTQVSTDWLKKRVRRERSLSRSFCAFPVEIKGKPWGIIVLDSRDEKGIKESPNPDFQIMSKLLVKLVERV